ncbi:ABC transporter permease [Mesorhizobium sp. VK23B]|uniref:ABC transporter permease n=1 Tax=Mesorhizobium dulcispinae TaxID=3072316 RepID=A0ABU4X887_9HYPH|nr:MULTISPECIES: ABC transporter permease [unclassified Mesorhizobium]MDX8464629.1 ABC transporter permease [Mesorhizobium sp. VK23B]MDX8471015.1 ABC transporter permease [Mesorhizobium sp. VK23A]
MFWRFLGRRGVMLLAAILIASFAIFGAMYLTPGSPIAALTGGKSISPEAVAALKARYHLDQPFLVQYWYWLTNALHGDLGTSITLRQDVSQLIAERAWITFALVAYAALLIVIFGIGLGIVAGLRTGWVDTSIVVISAAAAGIPSFIAAIVLLLVFSVLLGWFPAFGAGSGFGDVLWHLTLPAIALAVSAMAIVTRITRASVRQENAAEHVQTAISRGIPRRLVLTRHVLRNAAIPITTVTGITIASLIAISSVVDTAFGLGGLGQFLVRSAQSKDLAVVQGISLVLVIVFVVMNLIVDIIYAALDPRVKLGTRAS